MYYPYLRGKQFELILLRDNAEFLSENNIHPIIEPVKSDFKALIRAFEALNMNDVDCTLIINPHVGQEPINTKDILNKLIEEELKEYQNITIGFILSADTKILDLNTILRKYRNHNFSILHYGYPNGKEIASTVNGFNNVKRHIFIDGYAGKLYQSHLKKDGIDRILIRDGFKPRIKNSLYPPSEHFSDLHITFPDEGMDGFGDFLIVGDEYSETGGPAYAVAIHLTYLNNDDDMFIYHFISDQTDSPTDPGGKFMEALEKLIGAINRPNSIIFKSDACSEYLELFRLKHYPGLGYVKKLSMQHHIELIANCLE